MRFGSHRTECRACDDGIVYDFDDEDGTERKDLCVHCSGTGYIDCDPPFDTMAEMRGER